MTDEELKIYLENINKITTLLNENEKLIRKAGFNPPETNFVVDKDKRIGIPAGYIRKSGDFWSKYRLNEIAVERNTKNNISYALQLSDYYNFIVNRFNIWGSIEIVLYKQMFVNIVSIIEALILECASNINLHCRKCPKIGRCENNINKEERNNMKLAIEKLRELGILIFNETEKQRLIELYDLRNKVHIRLNKQNEFLDNKYNQKLYNEAIVYLKRIDEMIFVNGIQYYKKCVGFKDKMKGNTNSDL